MKARVLADLHQLFSVIERIARWTGNAEIEAKACAMAGECLLAQIPSWAAMAEGGSPWTS